MEDKRLYELRLFFQDDSLDIKDLLLYCINKYEYSEIELLLSVSVPPADLIALEPKGTDLRGQLCDFQRHP